MRFQINSKVKKVRNKSVAVLDIRSSEIVAAVAQKGVNNTFILKSKCSIPYDGFAEGELLDIKNFKSAIKKAYRDAITSYGAPVKQVFVGIPGEFLTVEQTDKVISFQSPERISKRHIESLINASLPDTGRDSVIIKCSPLYYVLSDNRKVISPMGEVSSNLRARLSFFSCKSEILECVQNAFESVSDVKVFNWVPSIQAEVLYLIEPEKRDNFAVMLDLGEISSTFAVACGNGIAFSESFSVGVNHVAVLLMEALDIPYDVALWFIKNVNLNAKEKLVSYEEYNEDGKIYKFPSAEIKEYIREGLDVLCGIIEECRQSYVGKDLSNKPLLITGEGVGVIRGLNEHLSSRLVTPVDVIVPKLPYYDKPQFSSLFSLLAYVLG